MKNKILNRVLSFFIATIFLFSQTITLANENIVKQPNELLIRLIEKSQYISYEIDDAGNISTVKTGGIPKIWYFYDEQNQLIRENNKILNKTIIYSYDSRGNIQNKKFYTFTDNALEDQIPEVVTQYEYANLDRMIAYDKKEISYNEFGNPIQCYNGWKFGWKKGNQLVKASKFNDSIEYKYNDAGYRIQKIVNGEATEFTYEGMSIGLQKSKDHIINWCMDENECASFQFNGNKYIYIWNMQNDIIGITDSLGNTVANYSYDTWGKLISITDENGKDITYDKNHIGYINPLRYRSYYYDNETELYYINSRYYNPETGRFLNEDNREFLKDNFSDIDISSYSLYAYCYNNPVSGIDFDGHNPIVIVGVAFTTPETIAIVSGLTCSIFYIMNPNYRNAINQTIGWAIRKGIEEINTIANKFKETVGFFFAHTAQSVAMQILKLVNVYNIQLRNKISSKIKTADGRIDISKFHNRNGPLGPHGSGRSWLGPLGYMLSKDMDNHLGSVWKLCKVIEGKMVNIASLAANGTILKIYK